MESKFYRYEIKDKTNSEIFFLANAELSLIKFALRKETPKGYWIARRYSDTSISSFKQWVSKTSKKRYAYPTKEEALKNFLLRTKRRVKILSHQLNISEIGISIAEKLII